MEFFMDIKQTITTADVELILKKLEKQYKKNSTILKLGETLNFLLVFLSVER